MPCKYASPNPELLGDSEEYNSTTFKSMFFIHIGGILINIVSMYHNTRFIDHSFNFPLLQQLSSI